MKEQNSLSGSDSKSAIASQSPAESVSSQQVKSDLSAVSVHSGAADDWWQMLDDELDEMKADDEEKKTTHGCKRQS